MMAVGRHLILFAHGARDPAWARPVQAVATRLRAENAATSVSVAFLEFLQPDLPAAVAACSQTRRDLGELLCIDILPFFIAQGGHLQRELPAMLAGLRQQHTALEFRLLPPLGEIPAVQAAMAQAIGALLR